MTDLVDLTLKKWRQSVFIYGQTDCLLSIGDYIIAAGGKDISCLFKGKYDTVEQALSFVKDHDGPHGIIRLCELLEIDPCDASRGDVVVIDTGTGPDGCIGALCLGDYVAARLERGVVEINRRLVKITYAWKMQNG